MRVFVFFKVCLSTPNYQSNFLKALRGILEHYVLCRDSHEPSCLVVFSFIQLFSQFIQLLCKSWPNMFYNSGLLNLVGSPHPRCCLEKSGRRWSRNSKTDKNFRKTSKKVCLKFICQNYDYRSNCLKKSTPKKRRYKGKVTNIE